MKSGDRILQLYSTGIETKGMLQCLPVERQIAVAD
jgi:hypothetical protein